MSETKMVIFDMDGVLVDACEWHRIALNKALVEICDYEITLKDHYETYNGIPTKIKLNKLTQLGIVPKEKQQLVYEKKQELTIDIILESAERREEKIELINNLKERGIIVACYTNSIRETAELMLDKTGVLPLLDFLLTNEEVEKCKPDPEGYVYILNKYKLNPDQVLIVEDSPKGLMAANSSGCKVLQVNNPDEVTLKKIEEYI